MKRWLTLIVVATLCLSISSAQAGFVNTWLSNYTSSGGNYFEGQKRNYYNGASFSYRVQQSNDALVTFQPPRLKFGCGGIDAYAGGFGFLSMDMLVKKLQRVLQMAPAAAFDIALNTLCQSCRSAMQWLENTANQLNSMSMDDCKSSRAMVATMMKPFASTDDQQKLTQIQSESQLYNGANSLWTQITDQSISNGNKFMDGFKGPDLSGCPDKVKAIFGTGGSLLQNVANQIGITDATMIDMIRGGIGDVVLHVPSANAASYDQKVYSAFYISPCSEDLNVDAFLNGTAQSRPIVGDPSTGNQQGGACAQVTDVDPQANISAWVYNKLLDIDNNMKNRQPLDSDQQKFIDQTPLPIMLALKNAIATNTEAATISTLSDLIAKALALKMINDIVKTAGYATDKAIEVVSASGGEFPPAQNYDDASGTINQSSTVSCYISGNDKAQDFRDTIFKVQSSIREAYSNTTQEMMNALGVIKGFQDANQQLNAEVGRRFNPSLARWASRH